MTFKANYTYILPNVGFPVSGSAERGPRGREDPFPLREDLGPRGDPLREGFGP